MPLAVLAAVRGIIAPAGCSAIEYGKRKGFYDSKQRGCSPRVQTVFSKIASAASTALAGAGGSYSGNIPGYAVGTESAAPGFAIVGENGPERPTVSGRELHEFLQVGADYRHWFPRMVEYGFTEGEDFNPVKIDRVQNEGGRKVTRTVDDHQLTIPMAKELCMIQRNERGMQARRYFIAVEEQWNGPELVYFNGGETVLTAPETRAAFDEAQQFTQIVSKNALDFAAIQQAAGLSENSMQTFYHDWIVYNEYEVLTANTAAPAEVVPASSFTPSEGSPISINFAPVYNFSGVSDTHQFESLLTSHDDDMREYILGVVEEAEHDKFRRAYA